MSHAFYSARKQHQRAAIGRAYAKAWRPAEAAELREALERINVYLQRWHDESYERPWRIYLDSRRRQVVLVLDEVRRDYRVTVRAGVTPIRGPDHRPIKPEDVERFEYRNV